MIERKAALHAGSECPRHVAVIMDGNRRWAKERGLATIEGHRAGTRALRNAVQASATAGITILTVYAFSEENWTRDPSEVFLLMELMRVFAQDERDALLCDNVRVRILGRTDRMPQPTSDALRALTAATAANDGLLLNIAIDYSARTELCDAVRALALDIALGKRTAASVDGDTLATYLTTAGLPDPDLLIRTGGELRLSNFLLYQLAYTELWSTPTHWPDFDQGVLASAIDAFASRQRRFGQ